MGLAGELPLGAKRNFQKKYKSPENRTQFLFGFDSYNIILIKENVALHFFNASVQIERSFLSLAHTIIHAISRQHKLG